MLNFLLGVVIGCVGGYVAKKQSDKKRHYNESGVSYASLYDVSQTELQKLKNHIKSQQEEHDELTCEIQSLKHKIVARMMWWMIRET